MTHSDVVAIPSLDLQRYLGTWYEIARLPMRYEPANATDVSAHYALDEDGKVNVRNRCRVEGKVEESVGQATPVDAGNSKLEVSFLPEGLRWIPFTKGDYWVLKLDADYQVALVGTPNREYLWLLARQPQLDAASRLLFLDEARRQGFDLSKLIDTPHTGAPTA
ncbi:lipocalin family protein [Stenotrophomonas sp. HITSZ_GD]|uniref:lipocalin family protein n=1 Tax=Stenotrophomonas sp. HITSZ_GD TaxID=3037248 RepID=UPI00240E08FF|nr:lipocalin family protein [Stenotrophomonas sp. HITSZ_GD]MDG2525283.1 lipocalin family protein [Stenotrophomonas sp. HITSZ_GD]